MLVAASVVVTAILCPIITVLWARVVLKQPAGGSREVEAAAAADLHVHLDHVPADTGETALEAAHLTVLDTAADRSPDSDRTRTADPGSGHGGGSGRSGSESTSDPRSPGPDPTGRGDVRRDKQMRDHRVVRCTYYIETDGDPRRGAEMLAGEQSSGTFVAVPGETDRIRGFATLPR